MATKQDYDKVRELTAQLDTWKQVIRDQMNNPEALTKAGMNIALLNSDISVYVAIFHETASNEKIETYLEERANKATQGDSEIIARKAELEPRKFYELTKAVVKSNEALMARLRDRLDFLKEENRNQTIKLGGY